MSARKLGIAVVGLGGAVGSTMVAGIELLKKGIIGHEGLPLAGFEADLTDYTEIVFGGWDLFPDHLARAAENHDVLTHKQFVAAEGSLRAIKPWPAVGNPEFLANIDGTNQIDGGSHRGTITKLRSDLAAFKQQCDSVVVINLASTEK